MAATEYGTTTVVNDTSDTAGGSVTTDVGSKLLVGRLAVEVTNATEPSTGRLLTVEVSNDNSTYVQIPQVRAPVTASTTFGFEFDVSGYRYIKLTYGSVDQAGDVVGILSGVRF